MDDVLRARPALRGLDDEAAAALRASMSERRLRRGDVLFHEGDPGDRLYVVTEGKVKLGRTSPDGRENMLAVLGPGRDVRRAVAVRPGPAHRTATALTEVQLLGLGHGDLQPWLNGRPEVAAALLRPSPGGCAAPTSRWPTWSSPTCPAASPRPCSTCPAASACRPRRASTSLHDLTQEELAQLVGASRETVNKALADFAGPRLAPPGGARRGPARRRAAQAPRPLSERRPPELGGPRVSGVAQVVQLGRTQLGRRPQHVDVGVDRSTTSPRRPAPGRDRRSHLLEPLGAVGEVDSTPRPASGRAGRAPAAPRDRAAHRPAAQPLQRVQVRREPPSGCRRPRSCRARDRVAGQQRAVGRQEEGQRVAVWPGVPRPAARGRRP